LPHTSDQSPAQAKRRTVQRDDERAQQGELPQRGKSAGERQERDQDTLGTAREIAGQGGQRYPGSSRYW